RFRIPPRARRFGFASTGITLMIACAGCEQNQPSTSKCTLLVAAAADLQRTAAELGEQSEKLSGCKVQFTFGSTELLARQIVDGAPFDVFLAADMATFDDLHRRGRIDGAPRRYACGR